MEDSINLNPAHIVLEAVRLTSGTDITALRQLTAANPQVLKLELVLRILLSFLPESTDPALFIHFLHDVSTLPPTQPVEHHSIPDPDISDEEATIQVQRLHLQPLAEPRYAYFTCDDTLTLFILHRAYQIETETGSLPLVLQLIEPFISRSECLQTWAISFLLPLLRLDYEYYPDGSGPAYSLEVFEALDGNSAIDLLLSKAIQKKREALMPNMGRDLRGLVGPWLYGERMRKRRKLYIGLSQAGATHSSKTGILDEDSDPDQYFGGWAHVNEWLLDLGARDFPQAVKAIIQWDGPRDVDYGDWLSGTDETENDYLHLTASYAQAALATVYATNDCLAETLKDSFLILQKIARLINLQAPRDLNVESSIEYRNLLPDFVDDLSKSHLLHNSLLRPSNPFTTAAETSIELCHCILSSNAILQRLGFKISCKNLVELSLFGSAIDQMVELRKILYNLQGKSKDPDDWSQSRMNLLKLRNRNYGNGGSSTNTQKRPVGPFSRVEINAFEGEILKALLNASCYDLAVEIYCKKPPNPVPFHNLEEMVLDAALVCYDGASNGNRTRGGVRKASEIILAFRSYFSKGRAFQRTLALISVTHSMSFYSLTLQHGVPFKPVNIRAHKDPISLVEKILHQNRHSYTKIDDLLEIGSNLVSAGITQSIQDPSTEQLDQENVDQEHVMVSRRITAMAIESALDEGDFDTAYSYVVNRLPPPDISYSSTSKASADSLIADDISWQAAYQAGKHPTNSDGPSALRRLEQRMELLSQALLLAPPSALSEILLVWRQCEEKMTTQMAQEMEEEEKWDDRGDRRIPGGYALEFSPEIQKPREPSRNAMNEEAPMGLFDVAKGAAAALSKNAFPLRNPRNSGAAVPIKTSHERVISTGGSDGGSFSGAESEGRVRKRDMVSNMVTGGLVSGIGWVIGASATRQE